ncbi:hypothetical protein D6817_05260 [Candidatus Pacearchaeota archaeon]|nr:MAG: hypothetical protein D6817_05260 [Candidatus Pacearchaeota archaeon]
MLLSVLAINFLVLFIFLSALSTVFNSSSLQELASEVRSVSAGNESVGQEVVDALASGIESAGEQLEPFFLPLKFLIVFQLFVVIILFVVISLLAKEVPLFNFGIILFVSGLPFVVFWWLGPYAESYTSSTIALVLPSDAPELGQLGAQLNGLFVKRVSSFMARESLFFFISFVLGLALIVAAIFARKIGEIKKLESISAQPKGEKGPEDKT